MHQKIALEIGNSYKCPNCGNTFYTHGDDWGYTIGSSHGVTRFCSWHCIREYEKRKEEEKSEKPKTERNRGKKHYMRSNVTGEVISTADLAKRYDAPPYVVYNDWNRNHTYKKEWTRVEDCDAPKNEE